MLLRQARREARRRRKKKKGFAKVLVAISMTILLDQPTGAEVPARVSPKMSQSPRA